MKTKQTVNAHENAMVEAYRARTRQRRMDRLEWVALVLLFALCALAMAFSLCWEGVTP